MLELMDFAMKTNGLREVAFLNLFLLIIIIIEGIIALVFKREMPLLKFMVKKDFHGGVILITIIIIDVIIAIIFGAIL